jgi:hypothetical protein
MLDEKTKNGFKDGLTYACIICLLALSVVTMLDSGIDLMMDSQCRDNSYPDSVNIKNQGWYCVGVSDGEPFLVKFEDVVE